LDLLGGNLTVNISTDAESGNQSTGAPQADMCGLGIVCDDLNSLKLDMDRFMSVASADYALMTAKSFAV